MDQLNLHKKIDEFLLEGPQKKKGGDLTTLISANRDARNYFFSQADEHWLDWLWKNGFLDVVKKASDDPSRYGYRTPELNYLASVANAAPDRSVKILLNEETATKAEKFNPEVIDQFLRICSGLPAEQLAQVVPKIRDERWSALMGKFNQWGFEYKEMIDTLAKAKDYGSVLVLAEAILVIRTKEEVSQSEKRYVDHTPFYFSDLSDTQVFEHLVSVDDDHKEGALAITTKALKDAILVGAKKKDGEVFEVAEYHFLDVDFFKLRLGHKERLSYREDITNLAATVKGLAEAIIGAKCSDEAAIRPIYEKYFQFLPDSQAMWRLQLFVLSLCPNVFKEDLKEKFYRVFDTDKYHELVSGAEYQAALARTFPALAEIDRQEYVNRVLDYFGASVDDEQEQRWLREYGWRFLKSAFSKLKIADEEKQRIENRLGKSLDTTHEPAPTIQFDGYARSVLPQAPEDSVWSGPVSPIIEKMKTEWTHKALAEKYRDTPFHRPINLEGVSEGLKKEMTARPNDFLRDAQLFFDRESLDPHYTYSYFRALHDLIREKRFPDNADLSELFSLMEAIVQSGTVHSFENTAAEEGQEQLLARWGAVHELMADVLQGLLRAEDTKPIIDFADKRNVLLSIFAYLLQYDDPMPKDEQLPTAKMKEKAPEEKEYSVSDPSHIAINSVRGRAFEAFLMFVYLDGQRFKVEEKKIAEDVKQLYKNIIERERTQAIMFLFGRHLPSFYFRDVAWFKKNILPQVFPAEEGKKDLFLAAWEGYLSNNLYEELFFDPDIQRLYERVVTLSPDKYTKRKYAIELDEGVATHIALAFAYYEDFGFDHPLFRAFWGTDNIERHSKFVAFIGRSVISGDNAKARELLQKKSWIKQRLKDFWSWVLDSKQDTKLLAEFGFWINTTSDVFDDRQWLAAQVRKTLESSQGALDWEYGLVKSIVPLAEAAPSDTVAILRLYLLEGGINSGQSRIPFSVDKEWFEAFKVLYKSPDTLSDTYALINDLIREGGSVFWKLKEVLNS
jgi:hypothetical protein